MIMRFLAGIVLMAAEMAVTSMVVVAPAPALVLMFNVSHAAAQDTDRREPVQMAVGPSSSLYSVDGLALGARYHSEAPSIVSIGAFAARSSRDSFGAQRQTTTGRRVVHSRCGFRCCMLRTGSPSTSTGTRSRCIGGRMKSPKTYNAIRRRSGSSHTSFSCQPAQGLPEALSPLGKGRSGAYNRG